MHEDKGIAIIIMVMTLLLSMNALSDAAEPTRPDVNRMFDAQKEAGINELAGMTIQEAFEQLKTPEYLLTPALMHKAIYRAFSHRKQAGLALQ